MIQQKPKIYHEGFKYILVGGFATLIDLLLFNLILLNSSLAGINHLSMIAKIISSSVAIVVAYFGHFWWTFNQRNALTNRGYQILLFFLVNIIGMLIALLCLWISRNVFGYTSVFSDNVSANIIGTILATIFRFTASRFFVFRA